MGRDQKSGAFKMAKVIGIFIILMVLSMLSGCSTLCKKFYPQEPIVVERIVTVKVPVEKEMAEPEVFILPVLPISDLTLESTPDEIVKKYAATVELLKKEVQLRDNALIPYRKEK